MECYSELPADRQSLIGCDGLTVPSFSYFKPPITNKLPYKDISLVDLCNTIRGNDYKGLTDKVRKADMTIRKGYQVNMSEYKRLKQTLLPFVTFGGTFTTRKKEGLRNISGYMCFDFDHIGNPEDWKGKLSSEPAIVMMFTSPSGDGLKVVYDDPFEEDDFKSQYEVLRKYFLSKYNLPSDATSDIARACFVCHDPDVWLRPQKNEYDLSMNLVDPLLGYPISWK